MAQADFNEVKIVKADSSIGATNKAAGNLTTTQASHGFGSSSDLWGEAWTPANINSANFGVVVAFQGSGHIITDYLTHYLKAVNFGFTIPTNATIIGIYVQINGKYIDIGSYADAYIYYIKMRITYTI